MKNETARPPRFLENDDPFPKTVSPSALFSKEFRPDKVYKVYNSGQKKFIKFIISASTVYKLVLARKKSV